jgi:F-type H+-transporting ATPase subunit a
MSPISADTIHHIIETTVGPSSLPVPLSGTTTIVEMAKQTGHVAAKATEENSIEIPNIITLLEHYFPNIPGMEFLHHFETQFFAFFIAGLIIVMAYLANRNKTMIPNPLQNFMEWVVESLDNLVCETIGPRGRQYTPFIGTLFVYIFCMNISGIIPFMKSPTSDMNTTFALALCVFFYVQYNGIKENGIIGYLDHLAGQPRDVITWLMVVLMFPLHILEELIKPVSLALRLFGNILGEDLLIGAFIGLGVVMVGFMHSPVGIPIHFPFLLLAILTSAVQALVFAMLTTIYILLMLPHEEDHEEAHATE